MREASWEGPSKRDELIAECRAALLASIEESCRAIRMSDDAWVARASGAAGQRFDELVGIRDRRGFEMARGLTASRISLIHEEDLDFSIELSELARKLHDGLEEELVRLSQRMRALLQQTDATLEQLPLGPETACEAMRALAEAAGLEPELRMKLLEQAHRPLEQRLRRLYADLNRRLDEAGIQANLAAPRHTAATTQTGQFGAPYHGLPGSGPTTPLGRLQQALLAQAPKPQSGTASDPEAAQKLQAVITRIDSVLVHALPGGSHGLRELMPLLPARKSCALEAVEQLFATMAQDTDLPAAIRAVLEKLHAPLFRQALHNERLLEDPDSMALALPETIAAVGYYLSQDLRPDDGTVRSLEKIVTALLASPAADEIMCSRAIDAVAVISSEQSQRIIAQGGPHHGLTTRAERRELALQTASKALRALIQTDTHAAVRQLLETYWFHLLAQAALRHGADEQAWRERLETANLLIRSAPQHPSTATRQELIRSLPELISRLRKGLAELGLDEQKATLALTPCMNLHSAIIAGTPMPEANWKSPPRLASLSGSKDPGGLQILQHGGHPAEDPRVPAGLQKVAVGERLRAELPDGTAFDGMVVWRAPRGHMLLLCNPRTANSLSISLRAAAEIAASGGLQIGRPTLAERTASRVLAQPRN